jgi:hypothetical protein
MENDNESILKKKVEELQVELVGLKEVVKAKDSEIEKISASQERF